MRVANLRQTIIYTWASDSGCSTVGEYENSVLRGLLKRLEDVAYEACSNEPRPRLFIARNIYFGVSVLKSYIYLKR